MKQGMAFSKEPMKQDRIFFLKVTCETRQDIFFLKATYETRRGVFQTSHEIVQRDVFSYDPAVNIRFDEINV